MVRFVKWVENYTQIVEPTTPTKSTCIVFNRNPIGKIHAFVSGNGSLYIAQSRDSFTYTAGTLLSNPSYVFDQKLDTYGSVSAMGPVSETDVLTIDYGSQVNRLIYIRVGTDAYSKLRFYSSWDGASWYRFLTITTAIDPCEHIHFTDARYLKITYENPNSGITGTAKFYEIWAVSTANCYTVTSTWESGVQRLSVGLPVYFVFLVLTPSVNPTTTCAIYEECVPSSVQGGEVG
ncbi:MAG: hypothetical protein QW540_07415 [Archaeoglobaceae archaeon]